MGLLGSMHVVLGLGRGFVSIRSVSSAKGYLRGVCLCVRVRAFVCVCVCVCVCMYM